MSSKFCRSLLDKRPDAIVAHVQQGRVTLYFDPGCLVVVWHHGAFASQVIPLIGIYGDYSVKVTPRFEPFLQSARAQRSEGQRNTCCSK